MKSIGEDRIGLSTNQKKLNEDDLAGLAVEKGILGQEELQDELTADQAAVALAQLQGVAADDFWPEENITKVDYAKGTKQIEDVNLPVMDGDEQTIDLSTLGDANVKKGDVLILTDTSGAKVAKKVDSIKNDSVTVSTPDLKEAVEDATIYDETEITADDIFNSLGEGEIEADPNAGTYQFDTAQTVQDGQVVGQHAIGQSGVAKTMLAQMDRTSNGKFTQLDHLLSEQEKPDLVISWKYSDGSLKVNLNHVADGLRTRLATEKSLENELIKKLPELTTDLDSVMKIGNTSESDSEEKSLEGEIGLKNIKKRTWMSVRNGHFQSNYSTLSYTLLISATGKVSCDISLPVLKQVLLIAGGFIQLGVAFSLVLNADGELNCNVECPVTSTLGAIGTGHARQTAVKSSDCQISGYGGVSDGFAGLEEELVTAILGIQILDTETREGVGFDLTLTDHTKDLTNPENLLCFDGDISFQIQFSICGDSDKTTVLGLFLSDPIECDLVKLGIYKAHCESRNGGPMQQVLECTYGKGAEPPTDAELELMEKIGAAYIFFNNRLFWPSADDPSETVHDGMISSDALLVDFSNVVWQGLVTCNPETKEPETAVSGVELGKFDMGYYGDVLAGTTLDTVSVTEEVLNKIAEILYSENKAYSGILYDVTGGFSAYTDESLTGVKDGRYYLGTGFKQGEVPYDGYPTKKQMDVNPDGTVIIEYVSSDEQTILFI